MAEAPIITSAVANSPGWITIAWTHSGQDGAVGYRIDRQVPPHSWTTNNHIGVHTDMGLQPGTSYSYRVCAIYPGGAEASTNWIAVTTQAAAPVPPPTNRTPPQLTPHEITPTSITLKWSGRRHERVHLRWRKNRPGDSPLEAQIDIDHEGWEGYRQFANLAPFTPYAFKIQVADINIFGTAVNKSEWSHPPLQLTTLPLPPPLPVSVTPIYRVTDSGDLLWYRRDEWPDSTWSWAANEGKRVGQGWGGFSTIFSGEEGVIYAVEERSIDPRTGQRLGGRLLWYRHDGWRDGTFAWAANEGKKVGQEWAGFSAVFPGHDGVIYAVTDSGDLLWYRHDGWRDGTFAWAANEGKKVGQGWGGFSTIFSGEEGVIYAVEERSIDLRTGQRLGGRLLWYRHDGWRDGTFAWAANEGKKVGQGWGGFSAVFPGHDGVIYAVTDSGDLLWYRHDGWRDGTFAWTANEGKKVGQDWHFKHLFSGGIHSHV